MSYLLFDSFYTRTLVDIGYRDASARIDEIEAFLQRGMAAARAGEPVEGGARRRRGGARGRLSTGPAREDEMSGEGYVGCPVSITRSCTSDVRDVHARRAHRDLRGGGSLARPDGASTSSACARTSRRRLHLLPRYRQRLHYVPVTGDPVWVDDDAFDIDLHVRHSHLPRPGTDAQLKGLIARLLERPLDRRRPLWEMYFVEGLPGTASRCCARSITRWWTASRASSCSRRS